MAQRAAKRKVKTAAAVKKKAAGEAATLNLDVSERASGVHGRAMDLRDPERPLNGELGDGADRPEMAERAR